MTQRETVVIRLANGDCTTMEVCGEAPPHKGTRTIVAFNGAGCFAARLTPTGWVVILEPVKLYPL